MAIGEFENTKNDLGNMNRCFGKLAGPGSKTAMGVLLARFAESRKPEGERICYDPYAIHFVSQDMLQAHIPHFNFINLVFLLLTILQIKLLNDIFIYFNILFACHVFPIECY